jgi:O-antigen biosynthesis protein
MPDTENMAPRPAEASPGLQYGVDIADGDQIYGWAFDPAAPRRRIRLELLVDDAVACSVLADRFRPDLLAAGKGDGAHGFLIRSLRRLILGPSARIRLRDGDSGVELTEAAGIVLDDTADFDLAAGNFVRNLVANAAARARDPHDLAAITECLVDGLRRVEDARLALGEPESPLAVATQRLLGGLEPLALPETDAPEASVIIPVHNKFDLTHACIASMIAHLPEAPFEVIIVDDCSHDETMLAGIAFTGGIRVVRNAKNLGFVGTCNAGAAVARGRHLFFLNNDTLMRAGWLDELLATFARDPAVGIAGSRLLFPDGKLQEAGGIIWRLADGWNWGRGGDANEPRFSFMRDADYVSGAALMIERALFEQLGGFDMHYAPAYYEDTDLCFRVRAAGRRVVVQPASTIVHLEGQSNGTDVNGPGLKRYQKINHRKFLTRWADTLAGHRMTGEQPALESERGVRRRALFIDDSVPTPDRDAGSNAAFTHMQLLQQLGHKVVFVPADNMARIDPYTAALEKRGIECLVHPWHASMEHVLRRAETPADVVYIHRFGNASRYLGMVRRQWPRARIVYCVADLHFLRQEREAALVGDAEMARAAAQMKREELAMVAAADACIVHSPAEAALLAELVPEAHVAVVSWPVRARPPARPFEARFGTCFLGGFGHPPNVDAVRWIGGEMRPLLGDLPVAIYGSGVTPEVQAEHYGNVEVMGHVPELAAALHRHRSTVAPLRYGAGIKGKVLESFAHGLPCVMTPIAAEGLALGDTLSWLVAADAAGIAAKLLELDADPALNAMLAEAGLAFIEREFGEAAVRTQLAAALEMAGVRVG